MQSLSPNVRGIVFMLLATGTFVINDTFLKLATDGLPPFEVLFLRGVAAAAWCLPLVLLTGNGPKLWQGANPIVLGRNLFELGAVLCFIVALAQMPIADITALNMTAPMLLLLGCALFFGDRIGWLRIVLILCGFGGAVLVAQPGGGTISGFAWLGFLSAAGAAARDILGRKVPAAIPALVVAYSTIIVVLIGAGAMHLLFEEWRQPELRHLLFLAGSGLFLTFGHLFLFLSYRTGATGVVAPFLYMFAVWAVLSGLLVFGTLPNALALIGIAVILASGVAIALLDERKRRLSITA